MRADARTFSPPLTEPSCSGAERLRGGRRRPTSRAQPRQQTAGAPVHSSRVPQQRARSPHQTLGVFENHHGAVQARRERGGGSSSAAAAGARRQRAAAAPAAPRVRRPAARSHQQRRTLRCQTPNTSHQNHVRASTRQICQFTMPAQCRGKLQKRKDRFDRGTQNVQRHNWNQKDEGGESETGEFARQGDIHGVYQAIHG